MFHTYTPGSFLSPERGSMNTIKEQARVLETWVDHPLFQWGDNEGFQKGVFGTRAGPTHSVFNTLHELAHCVQVEADRVVNIRESGCTGWDLRARRVYIPGYDPFVEPLLTQCSEREAEVMGIQTVLSELLFDEDVSETIEGMLPLFTWLPDYLNLPRGDGGYTGTQDPVRQDWIRSHIRTGIEKWSDPEAIRAELHRKLDALIGPG